MAAELLQVFAKVKHAGREANECAHLHNIIIHLNVRNERHAYICTVHVCGVCICNLQRPGSSMGIAQCNSRRKDVRLNASESNLSVVIILIARCSSAMWRSRDKGFVRSNQLATLMLWLVIYLTDLLATRF